MRDDTLCKLFDIVSFDHIIYERLCEVIENIDNMFTEPELNRWVFNKKTYTWVGLLCLRDEL